MDFPALFILFVYSKEGLSGSATLVGLVGWREWSVQALMQRMIDENDFEGIVFGSLPVMPVAMPHPKWHCRLSNLKMRMI